MDEARCRRLRVGLGEQNGVDGVAIELAGQSVGAHQDAVAHLGGDEPVVGFGVAPAADGAGDDIPPRVSRGGIRREQAAVDQLLHHGVVDADLLQLTLAQPVGPRIAEVHRKPVAHPVDLADHHSRQGGAGAGALARGELGHATTGPIHREVQVLDREARLSCVARELLHHGRAGDLACAMPAHAIRDEEQRRHGEEGVLVELAPQSGVARRAPETVTGGAGALMPGLPRRRCGRRIRVGRPRAAWWAAPAARPTRSPSRTRLVPFVENRSMIHAPAGSPPISKCVFESERVSSRSARATAPSSCAGLRPHTVRS